MAYEWDCDDAPAEEDILEVKTYPWDCPQTPSDEESHTYAPNAEGVQWEPATSAASSGGASWVQAGVAPVPASSAADAPQALSASAAGSGGASWDYASSAPALASSVAGDPGALATSAASSSGASWPHGTQVLPPAPSGESSPWPSVASSAISGGAPWAYAGGLHDVHAAFSAPATSSAGMDAAYIEGDARPPRHVVQLPDGHQVPLQTWQAFIGRMPDWLPLAVAGYFGYEVVPPQPEHAVDAGPTEAWYLQLEGSSVPGSTAQAAEVETSNEEDGFDVDQEAGQEHPWRKQKRPSKKQRVKCKKKHPPGDPSRGPDRGGGGRGCGGGGGGMGATVVVGLVLVVYLVLKSPVQLPAGGAAPESSSAPARELELASAGCLESTEPYNIGAGKLLRAEKPLVQLTCSAGSCHSELPVHCRSVLPHDEVERTDLHGAMDHDPRVKNATGYILEKHSENNPYHDLRCTVGHNENLLAYVVIGRYGVLSGGSAADGPTHHDYQGKKAEENRTLHSCGLVNHGDVGPLVYLEVAPEQKSRAEEAVLPLVFDFLHLARRQRCWIKSGIHVNSDVIYHDPPSNGSVASCQHYKKHTDEL